LRVENRDATAGASVTEGHVGCSSIASTCAAALRTDGFGVFVPHEHELATDVDVTATWIFAKDRSGIESANAMLRRRASSDVQGVIEDVGRIVASIEEARDVLEAWG
jgi:hypothetical protein